MSIMIIVNSTPKPSRHITSSRTVRVFGLGGLLGLERLRLALVVDGGHAELVVLAGDQVGDLELGVAQAARRLAAAHPAAWRTENGTG